MPDVGDYGTATLTVIPADDTTTATLQVRAPDGTLTTPSTVTADHGTTWTATVPYTAAGVWQLRWTVTGVGAGQEQQLVAVAPGTTQTYSGRVYATSTQLALYLGAAPPVDSDRLLARASELLDAELLLACWYDTDDDTGMPTDPLVLAGFAEAACAQVEYWGEVGEESDMSGPVQAVRIGSAQIQYGKGADRTGPDYVPPRVVRALENLPGRVFRSGVAAPGLGRW